MSPDTEKIPVNAVGMTVIALTAALVVALLIWSVWIAIHNPFPVRHRKLHAIALLIAAALLVWPRTSLADDVVWNEAWPRFRTWEYIATGTALAGVAVSLFAVPQREDAFQRGFCSMTGWRERLTLGNYNDRQKAVLAGDIFYYGLFAYPAVADIGIAALAVHRNTDVAWQMFMIHAQAYGITGLVSTLTQKLIGRNRPFADKCADNPYFDPDCDEAGTRSQSFISGHTAVAFTGAGLMCAHHEALPLYGGGAADTIACGTALAGATVVFWSRIVADRHYMSDAISGVLIGLGSGYLMPRLLHFWPSEMGPFGGSLIVPYAAPDAAGLTLTGLF